MRTIYLSAHLDDTILSCGGLIYDQTRSGMEVEIWTFFTATPPGKDPTNYLKRIEEDKRAVEIVGARYKHFDNQECFGRNHATVTEPVREDERELIHIVSEQIFENVHSCKLIIADRLMCPLAIGSHVDHVILQRAAEKKFRFLTYYVDFPYVEYLPGYLYNCTKNMVGKVASISPEGLEKWILAVKTYKSQDFYPTQDITEEKLRSYWNCTGGISLWRKKYEEGVIT